MLNEEFDIPRNANAGVAFLGVELVDAWIVIAGVFLGLGVGFIFGAGAVACMGIIVACYLLNKWYVGWRAKTVPGQIRTVLFRAGLLGYSKAYRGGNVVYVGDSLVINPDAHELVDRALVDQTVRGAHGT